MPAGCVTWAGGGQRPSVGGAAAPKHLSPTTIVFMSVIQRTSKGRHLAVSLRCFNRRAKAFNAKLAARFQFMPRVYLYTQQINHPRFICYDGCHLTDEGVQKYGEGILRAVL